MPRATVLPAAMMVSQRAHESIVRRMCREMCRASYEC